MPFNLKDTFLKSKIGVSFLCLFSILLISKIATAQDTVHFTLAQVVRMGMDSSKTLHISTTKVDEAVQDLEQAKEGALPEIKASFTGSEAFLLTRTLQIEGLMKEPMRLPDKASMYLGTLSINEPIFEGNKIKYARQSASLLHQIAALTAGSDSEDIKYDLIQSYINLYKIDENQKIMVHELEDVQGRLNEVIQFENHGLATDNDVLRFQLQKAKVELNQIDLANERAVANYAMCLLLGIPGGTYIQVDSVDYHENVIATMPELIANALESRKEISIYDHKNELSEINIRELKDDRLPTLGAGITGYYLNPNTQFIPPENSFLAPVTVGLNLSWNISSLYNSKHKIEKAKIQQKATQIAKSAAVDKIKMDVSKQYHDYLQSLKKIEVLNTAVKQAKENDRIMELKYENQLATTTDRIDAQTMLYQTLVNLSIAKAEASTAYYQLLRATGVLTKTIIN